MEFFIFAGLILLGWLCWQLYRAKQFTKFRRYIESELKPIVVQHITEGLEQSRSDTFPNTPIHKEAALKYWQQYHVRLLQYALAKELLTKEEMVRKGKWRYCQHLFAVEGQYLCPSLL